MTDFRQRVLRVVRRIPRGRVATYGDVARLAGRPRAWRAVGTVLRECRDGGVPCHRVVGAGGALGGFSDLLTKRLRLEAEGLTVSATAIRGFSSVRWPPEAATGAAGQRGGPRFSSKLPTP
ncbi:MAG: MGMT family protein [Vicinamibacterales bacterium]